MKTYRHYVTSSSGKVHTADTWSDRTSCGASMAFASQTSAPVTCKRCKSITYGKN